MLLKWRWGWREGTVGKTFVCKHKDPSSIPRALTHTNCLVWWWVCESKHWWGREEIPCALTPSHLRLDTERPHLRSWDGCLPMNTIQLCPPHAHAHEYDTLAATPACTWIYIQMYTKMYTCSQECTHTCPWIHTHAHEYTQVHMDTHMCTWIYIPVHKYTYTEGGRMRHSPFCGPKCGALQSTSMIHPKVLLAYLTYSVSFQPPSPSTCCSCVAGHRASLHEHTVQEVILLVHPDRVKILIQLVSCSLALSYASPTWDSSVPAMFGDSLPKSSSMTQQGKPSTSARSN